MYSTKMKKSKLTKALRQLILKGIMCLLILTTGCQLNNKTQLNGQEQFNSESTSSSTSRMYDRMDLSQMYLTPEVWREHFNALKDELKTLSKETETLESALSGTGDRLIESLKRRERLEREFDKLSVYAMLYRDMDFSNDKANALYQLIENNRGEVSLITSKYDDALYTLNKKKMASLIKLWQPSSEKEWLESVIESTYIPNRETNRIRSASQSILGGPENLFSAYLYLEDDEDAVEGREASGDFYSNDAHKRQLAYDAEKKKVLEGQDIMAAALSSEVAMNIFEARSYGYDRAEEMYLDQDQLSETAYQKILDRPYEHLDTYQQYLEHLKKQMKLEKLHYYDRSLEPTFELKSFPIENIKTLLLEVFSPLGRPYTAIVDKAFLDHWLDLGGRAHKYEGAYTLTAYDSHPYIVMTYEDDLLSAATLGHELGHLVNDVMTNEKQSYQNSTITSIKAEMASTTNEVLLYDYILSKTTDVEERKGILKAYIDFINDAYFYQTALSRFQDRIHEGYLENQALTADYFNEVMGKELETLYGKSYEVMDYDKVTWASSNHLYWGFYVYKYPLGAAVAFHNAQKIEMQDESFIKKYNAFLSSGSKLSLEEDLKEIGINLTEESYFEAIESKYESLVKEYIELTK